MDNLITSLQQIQTLAAFIGLVVLLILESSHPFFDFFRAGSGERGRHALRNLAIGIINGAVVGLVFVSLWWLSSEWSAAHQFGLLRLARARFDLPDWINLIAAGLLLDFWTYLWHRLNHTIPFLWRFHRVHHADAHMDVTTAGRFHIGEIVFSSALRIPLIVLLGIDLWHLLVYETVMFAVVQIHHANIALPERLDRALRAFIVTPAMHKVHHSRWQPETDSNYSSLFSFWDRIGRSFRLRPDLKTLSMGLDEFDAPEANSFTGMMKIPFTAPPRRTNPDPD